jgi:hypothetical protein
MWIGAHGGGLNGGGERPGDTAAPDAPTEPEAQARVVCAPGINREGALGCASGSICPSLALRALLGLPTDVWG